MAQTRSLDPDEKTDIGELGPKLIKIGGIVAGVGLGATVLLGFLDNFSRRFFYAYLLAVCFFVVVAAGALFFVLLQHLVRAKWSVPVRRIAEILTMTFPVLGLMTLLGVVLPMLLGNDELYRWSDATFANANHLVHMKLGYLNVPFFAIRCVLYFVIWTGLSFYFYKKSVDQDKSGDPKISDRLRVVSAPGLIVYAFTTSFFSFDFLMSLCPEWFSTMFGVYFFAGCAMTIFASLTLISLFLQKNGILKTAINVEHYHDLGKLMFAFVFFWSYVAFSQFMLIWYANMPEETLWFASRMGLIPGSEGWQPVAWLLLLGHFAFPFLFLLSRWTKRIIKIHVGFCIWLLLMQYLDLFWIAIPEASYDNGYAFSLNVMDFTAWIGMAGVFVATLAWIASKSSLIPLKDPGLGEGLAFKNY